jgi:flagellar biosynthesis anti-sigma factor FlgM
MNMRIDLYSPASSDSISSDSAAKSSPANQLQNRGSSEDRATLTSGSNSVDSLVSAAMNSPEVRSDKVASLQQQVQNGTYQLDPDKIAGSMIDELA